MRKALVGGIAITSVLLLARLSPAQLLSIDADTLTADPPLSTGVQDIKPIAGQRGVAIDGSLRLDWPAGLAIAGNPWEDDWNNSNWFDKVRMDTGAYSVDAVDIALPAPGVVWVVGRSYNPVQHDGAGTPAYRASNGPQGSNWFQNSQPELIFDDDVSNDSNDRLYLVYRADAFIEFARVMDESTPTDVFRAVNGAAGAIEFVEDANGPNLYRYTDQVGYEAEFFGFDDGSDIPSAVEGQLWRITIPTGAHAYLGHETAPATAITQGFFSDGKQKLAYDTAGRRYTYSETASAIGGIKRYEQVKAEIYEGGNWVEVARVEYDYYTSDGSHGSTGDLQLVTVTTPLSAATTEDSITKTYYRYWQNTTYNSGTNPGAAHLLKMVVASEGLRQQDYADTTFDEDFLAATDTVLEPYSDAYIKYYDYSSTWHAYRAQYVTFNGLCGCAGGTSGTYTFSYDASGYSNTSGYDDAWATRTVVNPPSGMPISPVKVAQYFDEANQPLSRVEGASFTSGTRWTHGIERTAAGFVEKYHFPAHVSGYDHSTGAVTYKTDDGLVHIYGRATSGDLTGFATSMSYIDYDATSDPQYLIWSRTFYDDASDDDRKTVGGVYDVVVPLIDNHYEFVTKQTSGSTDAEHTAFAYTFHDKLVLESMTETEPTVAGSEHGAGAATTIETFYNEDATPAWRIRQDGVIEYRGYDDFAQLNVLIEDANTSSGDFTGVTIPTGVSSSGSPLHAKTTYTHDDQGRVELVTPPDGRAVETFYTQLADGRLVVLTPALNDGGDYYGPVSYAVLDHAGNAVVEAVIGLDSSPVTTTLDNWIDTGDDDPITAFEANGTAPAGDLVRMTARDYSESGARLAAERVYFAIPAASPGDTDNYDITTYSYDAMGRRDTTIYPSGTAILNGYNARGKVSSREMAYDNGQNRSTWNPNLVWVGTYDAVSGTSDGTGGNGAGTGDGELTVTQCYNIIIALGERTANQLLRDQRGFVRAIYQTQAPHMLIDRDVQGRVTAIGLYNEYADGDLGDRTLSALSYTTDRVGLVEFDYDTRGQLWKTTWHKIDWTDGSSDDTLTDERWFDATGRLVKRDGDELLKIAYDRLNRPVRQFVLASDNDSGYADADDVTGDLVLAEHQTVYDGVSDDVLIRAVIERFHDDYSTGTTGALDDNADANASVITAADLNGRAQVQAFWYDALGRVDTQANYGQFDGTSFSHGSTKPTASVAEGAGTPVLVEKFTYDAAGELFGSVDPMGIEDRYSYDDAGRILKMIENYVDGTAGGGTNGDEDRTTEREYTTGLITKLIARNPAGNDQITEYVYGTTFDPGITSDYESGHLLHEIHYPDSTGSTDIVKLEYGKVRKVSKITDQAGNVISIGYDTAARESTRSITAASGFDSRVAAIQTEYDALGRLMRVYQENSSGTDLDDAKFEYDGWGGLIATKQDANSAFGTTDGKTILYGHRDINDNFVNELKKATGGRNAIRRETMIYPSGLDVDFDYLVENGGGATDIESIINDKASRVYGLQVDGLTATRYKYLGRGRLVYQSLEEPSAISKVFFSTPHDYSGLDRYNRVIRSSWRRQTGNGSNPTIDLYDRRLTYDFNSNPTAVDDLVLVTGAAGFDSLNEMDDLDRLIQSTLGTLTSGSISTKRQDEVWELSQLGNASVRQLDLNGDGDLLDSGDLDDAGTFNDANELTQRDLETDGDGMYDDQTISLTFDAVGNLTDDGEAYTYVYDPVGRLVQVKNRSTSALVAEYRYNGLGYRIAAHYDITDDATPPGPPDGQVDEHDPWQVYIYDERWRIVETYRAVESGSALTLDSAPKEVFVYHAAGDAGFGSSSYVDAVVLRDRDATGTANSDPAETWSFASDAVLEERVYYLHDWHQDLVQLIGDDGAAVERVHYSAYGVPFGLHPADLDLDGDVDGADFSKFSTLYSNGTYNVLADFDHDGDEDAADYVAFATLYSAGETLGRGNLSRSTTDNRVGYAGYQWDRFVSKYHVRNRVYEPTTGRWVNRDPIDYTSGLMNLYEYVGSRPERSADPFGLYPYDGFTPGDQFRPGKGWTPAKPVIPKTTEPAHLILDAVGTLDPTPVCDGVNACLYAAEGQYVDAGISVVCCAPFIGDIILKPGRWGLKITKWLKKAKNIDEGLDEAIDGITEGIKKGTPPSPGGEQPIKSIYPDGTPVYNPPPRLGDPMRSPIQDPNGPIGDHSVIRWDPENNRIYQLRTYDASGRPVCDIDMTLPTTPNGTPRPGHTAPEVHPWLPNPSGGSPIRQQPGLPPEMWPGLR